MSTVRIIKKYPNRRLYDTELSRYITLSDLRKFIYTGGNFKVIDASSEEDITRNILLQIITEQESGGQPLFTTEILMQMVRLYGGTVQEVFTDYLQKSLQIFAKQQNLYQDRLNKIISKDPVSAMTELAKKNLAMWHEVQKSFLIPTGYAKGGSAEEEAAEEPEQTDLSTTENNKAEKNA